MSYPEVFESAASLIPFAPVHCGEGGPSRKGLQRNALILEALNGRVPADRVLLRADEVALLLGVRTKRVYELGIPSISISTRGIRWRCSDVLAFINPQFNSEVTQ